MYEVDVRSLLPSVRVPTTVLHCMGDRVCPIEGGRYLAEHIPGAELIEMEGGDHFALEPSPEMLAAVRRRLEAGREPVTVDSAAPERRLATVLFTDIVNSTATAAARGDAEWTTALELHDTAAARVVEDHQGRVTKTTGDGLVATFDGPSRAVDCAAALHTEIANIGLPIRAGLHTGEIELRSDGDIAGMGVHIAARVSGLAGSGETMASRTVRDLCVGSGHTFNDAGEHVLKGVEDMWQCYRLGP